MQNYGRKIFLNNMITTTQPVQKIPFQYARLTLLASWWLQRPLQVIKIFFSPMFAYITGP